MTYVTCPTVRYHPAVVAQKAATIGVLSEGRFTLGLGREVARAKTGIVFFDYRQRTIQSVPAPFLDLFTPHAAAV